MTLAGCQFYVKVKNLLSLYFKVSFKVFQNVGLFEAFRIPEKSFLRFFYTLERGYHDIPCEYFARVWPTLLRIVNFLLPYFITSHHLLYSSTFFSYFKTYSKPCYSDFSFNVTHIRSSTNTVSQLLAACCM